MSNRIERERADRLERLKRQLDRAVVPINAGGGPLSDVDRCTLSAHEAAQRGDLDEVELQLRLRDQPKWSRVALCEADYFTAMAAKRGVSA